MRHAFTCIWKACTNNVFIASQLTSLVKYVCFTPVCVYVNVTGRQHLGQLYSVCVRGRESVCGLPPGPSQTAISQLQMEPLKFLSKLPEG